MRIQELELRNGDRPQAGSLFIPEEPTGAAVLLMHGYESNRQGYAEYAQELTAKLGAICLTIDLPGHGDSGGDFKTLTMNEYGKDVQHAYKFLEKVHPVDKRRVGVMGASFSGFLAVTYLDEGPKSMLLRAPAIYPDGKLSIPRQSIDPVETRTFREGLDPQNPPRNLALQNIQHYNGEVTIVESSEDESIPASVMDTYTAMARRGIHKTIKGAGHSLRGEHRQEFKEILVDWAAEL
ncbi:MAG: alpha/beta hydrolase [Candidatus Saccharibacteria bacterium]|nr:alpha/beta hydrolase [Candidatus Saccharibacteria bacterium]